MTLPGGGIGLVAAVAGRRFYPTQLGAHAVWDAERPDLLTLSGSSVSSFADVVGGYALTQSVSASKPVYSASSFNGRPGITFDGTDDFLELTGVPFPTGTSTGELWALVRQDHVVSFNTTNYALAAGAGTAGADRRLGRAVVSAVNRSLGVSGNGSSSVSAADATVDFSGIHVLRLRVEATQIVFAIDGGGGATSAVNSNTSATRIRMGASAAAVAAAFWNGAVNMIASVPLLGTTQASAMLAFMKHRGGVA